MSCIPGSLDQPSKTQPPKKKSVAFGEHSGDKRVMMSQGGASEVWKTGWKQKWSSKTKKKDKSFANKMVKRQR